MRKRFEEKMTLQEYIQSRKISITKLAVEFGIGFHQLYRLTKGSKPSLELALMIEKKTGGKVRPRDFLRASSEKKDKREA